MKPELRNIKHNQALSEETDCFSATLYIDGKKAAEVGNHGHGGPCFYHFSDPTLRQQFEDYCKSLPPEPCSEELSGGTIPMDSDLWAGIQVENFLKLKDLKRICGKGIAIKFKVAKRGEYTQFNCPYTPENVSKLRAKHGDQILYILNEKLAKGELVED